MLTATGARQMARNRHGVRRPLEVGETVRGEAEERCPVDTGETARNDCACATGNADGPCALPGVTFAPVLCTTACFRTGDGRRLSRLFFFCELPFFEW